MNELLVPFAIPFALMCLFLLLRRAVPPSSRAPGTRNQGLRLVLELGLGLALLLCALWNLPGQTREARIYRSDWACRQGTQLSTTVKNGTCTVRLANVLAHLEHSPKYGDSYYFDIDTWDGHPHSAHIEASSANMTVWNAVNARSGVAARVQFVNGRAALVATDAGTATTDARPQDRLSTQEVLAAFGAGLVVASLLEMLIGSFILSAGW